MLLSREQILAAEDFSTDTVAVPEWGGEVLVRGLTGTERDALEMSLQEDKTNIRARFVAKAVIGADHQPLFSEGDVEALGQKNAAPLDRVFSAVQRLSGLGADAVKVAEKNSDADHSDDSASD